MGLGDRVDYAALAEIVFSALGRAHPELTRAEFDDWPLPCSELAGAIPVIAEQTGMMEKRRSGSREPAVEAPNWDSIIADFVNFLPGTTPDYWEDALTGIRLKAMREAWRLYPPTQVLAAGWMGYKPRQKDEDALSELMRMFPDGKLRGTQTLH